MRTLILAAALALVSFGAYAETVRCIQTGSGITCFRTGSITCYPNMLGGFTCR